MLDDLEVLDPLFEASRVALPKIRRPRIWELRRADCRWPVDQDVEGQHLFCGERQTTGRPYCAAHAGMAYVALVAAKRAA